MQCKRLCVVADLDGTLAIMGPRNPYDDMRCYCDSVNIQVLEVLCALMSHNGLRAVFVSGRQSRSREETERWLDDMATFPPLSYDLFMRETGDNRPDDVVKEEIYRTKIEPNYDVFLVLDDRDKVVKMWRKLGLTCFQVQEGNF